MKEKTAYLHVKSYIIKLHHSKNKKKRTEQNKTSNPL